ncbi:cyclin-K [Condylostylus longicornis]|uniref:cyclin-K n=1 Tax=Condylostylus longicornis TaxID=2530218 RepID=UPI00244DEAB3|nr:cyclin-K [Condylostylus longicornis]
MKECVFVFHANTEMPCWYYEKKDLKVTPSILDGLSPETERRYRKEGARFIMQCGTAMSLGHNTMATGVVYFHRFYMFHSFKQFPRYVTACCCLFLAGKVEETPKKARDIIRNARNLLSDDKFYSFGDDPKEEVMTLERILLQTIKFDLQVEHPYGFLVKYAKCLKGDQSKLQKMVQMAWNFVNDSLSTTVCLQWEPEIIAVAMIHLASKLSKFTVLDWVGRQPQHLRWWDMFVADVTMEILEDICHQVLDLYQQPQNPECTSPPQQPPSRMSSPPTTSSNISVKSINETPSSSTAINNTNNNNNIVQNNIKRPTTPPPPHPPKSVQPAVASVPVANPIPVLKPTIPPKKEDKIEGNPIPKLLTSEPPLPPQQSSHYSYQSTYGHVYPTHTAHYGPGSSVPPPPQPPIYGNQYTGTMQTHFPGPPHNIPHAPQHPPPPQHQPHPQHHPPPHHPPHPSSYYQPYGRSHYQQ